MNTSCCTIRFLLTLKQSKYEENDVRRHDGRIGIMRNRTRH